MNVLSLGVYSVTARKRAIGMKRSYLLFDLLSDILRGPCNS